MMTVYLWLLVLGGFTFAYASVVTLLALQVWRRRSLFHPRWFALALVSSMGGRLLEVTKGVPLTRTQSVCLMSLVLVCAIRGLWLLWPPSVRRGAD